jgi:hypothetical protein
VAERREIEVVIGAGGELSIVTRGLHGQACLAETRALEQALGEVRRREKTSEFYGTAAGTKAGVKGR